LVYPCQMGCGVSAASGQTFKPAVQSAPTKKTDDVISPEEASKQKHAHDWQIWNELDLKDEAERVKLAGFLRSLYAIASAAENEGGAPSPKSSIQEHEPDSSELVIEVDYRGVKLPSPLTMESVVDMINTYKEDNPPVLHKKYCWSILKEATAILAAEENVNMLPPATVEHPVTVVGDLHGSMVDLAKIFATKGWPSSSHTYVFNGDFVDRGEFGIEVLMAISALKIVLPSNVFLNRGNHEDKDICQTYGFFEEVIQKYNDEHLYHTVCRLFGALPLCTLVANTAFVVHGGLFRNTSIGLEHIRQLNRSEYLTTLAPMERDPGYCQASCQDPGADPEVLTKQDLAEMLEDMVWSDPDDEIVGWRLNETRQAGIFFGNDVICNFLNRVGVKVLVRSHECIQNGAETWGCGDGCEVWTVFSASNYSNGDNKGAVLSFTGEHQSPVVACYMSRPVEKQDLAHQNKMTLVDLIVQHKHLLRDKFEQDARKHDEHRCTPTVWASIVKEVLEVNIDWGSLQDSFAPSDSDGLVHFHKFLDQYMVGLTQRSEEDNSSLQLLYSNHRQLKAVFKFLDSDHSGSVDRQEFTVACDMLNKISNTQIVDGAELFQIIDIDDSGEIDFNELCECFRLHGETV